MSKLIIEGGKKLAGRIEVAGDKNSTLPILAATLLTKGLVTLHNVPRIQDVLTMISVLEHLGVNISWRGTRTLIINTEQVHYADLTIEAVGKLRGSILFLGSMLARFHKVVINQPGGDIIGARPIDTHLEGLETLGVKFETNHKLRGSFLKLKASEVILRESSVTGTENLMLVAALQAEKILIKLAAMEPSVQTLGQFLKKLGVKITGLGTPFMMVQGQKRLAGRVSFTIPGDPIEMGTFACLAGATKSKLEIVGVRPEVLDSFSLVASEMGLQGELRGQNLVVTPGILRGTKIQVGLYPKLLTDFQPVLGVLATQASGVTLIHDWLYENRFGYLRELAYMGANVEIIDPHRAIISGPTPLVGKEVRSLDLRAGIALVIAALAAKGTTIIHDAQHIDRGYERLDERLRGLGAQVERVA